MKSCKSVIFLFISLFCVNLNSQTACVKELTKIYESDFTNVRIEPSGKLSYTSGEHVISSNDDGVTWNETVIPRHLNAPSRKGLENGNYIWHTDSTMYYQENDEWRVFEINGDSVYTSGPHMIGDIAFVIQNNKCYSYNDNTKEIKEEFGIFDFQGVTLFKNHFIVHTSDRHYVLTNDFEISNIIAEGDRRPAHITEEGYYIRYFNVQSFVESMYSGAHYLISRDKGETYDFFWFYAKYSGFAILAE